MRAHRQLAAPTTSARAGARGSETVLPPRSRWLAGGLALAAALLLPPALQLQPLAPPQLVLAVLLASASWAYLPAALLLAGRASLLVGVSAVLFFASGLAAREDPVLLPWLAAGHAVVGVVLARLRPRPPREATAWWAWACFHGGLATWA